MNISIFSGRLGKDPVVRYTQSGKAVANLRIAVDDGFGDKKQTYWFDVVAWEKLAETCGEHLATGSRVLIESRATQKVYEKNGNKTYSVEFVANRIEFLDPKSERQSGPGSQAQSRPVRQEDSEDLPF